MGSFAVDPRMMTRFGPQGGGVGMGSPTMGGWGQPPGPPQQNPMSGMAPMRPQQDDPTMGGNPSMGGTPGGWGRPPMSGPPMGGGQPMGSSGDPNMMRMAMLRRMGPQSGMPQGGQGMGPSMGYNPGTPRGQYSPFAAMSPAYGRPQQLNQSYMGPPGPPTGSPYGGGGGAGF